MHSKRFFAIAAALCIGVLAFQAQAGPRDKDYRKAVRLYRNGMYERAKDIFEDLGRKGDILGEGYSALCASRMQTAGFMEELDSYLLKYPESALAPQVHFEKGLAFFDAGDYAASRREFASISGASAMVLTKMDGTGKGGAACAAQSEFGLPILFVGLGEQSDDLQVFDPETYANAIFPPDAGAGTESET